MRTTFEQLLRHLPVIAAIAFVLGSSTPAHAEVHCFMDLATCYGRAASLDSYWSAVAASADCELDFVGCTRRAIIGR